MNRILVTGSSGQLGSDLVAALYQHYGAANIIESGWRISPHHFNSLSYEVLDVTHPAQLNRLIER